MPSAAGDCALDFLMHGTGGTGFNQVRCMDTLKAVIGAGADRGESIYAFLDAYGFSTETINVSIRVAGLLEQYDVDADVSARNAIQPDGPGRASDGRWADPAQLSD